jgi:hypothetical protein
MDPDQDPHQKFHGSGILLSIMNYHRQSMAMWKRCKHIKSQATTVYSVLWIQDVYPGSQILIFTHPGSRIPDPGSRISDPGSRIPHPKTATKERGEKKFVVITFYVATNFTKLQLILVLKKKIWANFSKNYRTFYPKKLSLSSQKYGFWIRDPEKPIPDPGVKKAPDFS